MIAIAIDDEPQALDVIRIFSEKVSFLTTVKYFTNAFEAIEYLQKHPVDLLFLDIKMPDITGIDLVGCLNKTPMVIFTTAYSDFAVQGFDLNATDYLLKPFSLARFVKACNKAFEKLEKDTSPEYIFIKTGYEEEKVLLNDILYIESEGNYLNFILTDRKLVSRQTMGEVLLQLPSARFARIHRSFIVPLDKIDKLQRNDLWIGKKLIPVGVSYEEAYMAIRKQLLL